MRANALTSHKVLCQFGGEKIPPLWSIYTILEKLNCPLKIKKTKGDTLGLLDDSVGSLDGTI